MTSILDRRRARALAEVLCKVDLGKVYSWQDENPEPPSCTACGEVLLGQERMHPELCDVCLEHRQTWCEHVQGKGWNAEVGWATVRVEGRGQAWHFDYRIEGDRVDLGDPRAPRWARRAALHALRRSGRLKA